MKNLINYLYNIDVIDIKDVTDGYFITAASNNYILKNVTNINNLDFVINLINNVDINYLYFYKIKRNIFYNFISNIKENNYVLIDVSNNYNDLVDFNDMVDFYNKSNRVISSSYKYNNSWEVLWENKIDYLINYAKNNEVDNKKVMPLFYYYIGLAETALLYLKDINKKYPFNRVIDKISLVHRRVGIPNIKLNFFNPFNFIIDLEVRDIAEYIKILYYSDSDYLSELEYYLKINILSVYTASMLFVRIIYPSYFFDYFESKTSNIKTNKFLDTKSYENFIKKTYELISSYVQIDKIEYLIDQY